MGINNIGATTQSKLLVKRMIADSYGDSAYVKYPIYDNLPTGLRINSYLREGNPDKISPDAFQMLNVLNKTHFEPKLLNMLSRGNNIIAEDYVGTALAWSIGTGMKKDFAVDVNRKLLREDLTILLNGERFTEGKEAGHTHEEDSSLLNAVAKIHEELAFEFGWHIVDANGSREEVHENIWKIVKLTLCEN